MVLSSEHGARKHARLCSRGSDQILLSLWRELNRKEERCRGMVHHNSHCATDQQFVAGSSRRHLVSQ